MTRAHEGLAYAQRFFTPSNAGSYESVARYATLGRDEIWKAKVTAAVASKNIILDLACGTGFLTSMLASAEKVVVGLDLSLGYLAESRKNGSRHNFQATQGTAEVLPYRDSQFDAVVSSYLAKYVDIRNVVRECERVLRPGGIVVFHDFTLPSRTMMRLLWQFYFRVLTVTGLFMPPWRTVFRELEGVIERSRWEEKTLEALKEFGFVKVTLRYYTGGTAAIISAEKP
jgi:demethylmenaquinone methyltransferase/2-methoxy-6-polyprenyl-1,4-benzoquinol methylase